MPGAVDFRSLRNTDEIISANSISRFIEQSELKIEEVILLAARGERRSEAELYRLQGE